ncbi:MAG: hypothetical protein D6699_08675 [Aquificota bacterium]|nr:MAG: hypothetical protein D6699_08675 [Aquificota bacterium]
MKDRLSWDIKLQELIQECKQAKEVLSKYGYTKLEEEDIEDIVIDKLTLKGFCRLVDLDEESQEKLWQEILDLYKRSEE